MELRQIKYFITVAEELHFGHAASKLGIAQPALSQQIQQLEQELGGALLNRNKRSVSLTDGGKIFLTEAKVLLAQSLHAQELARQAFSGTIGELILGFVESATWDILPKVILNYRKQYPNVKITLRHLHTVKQINALQQGNIHVGIIGLPISDPNICCHKIKEDPFLVALPIDHPLSSMKEIFITDLAKENFVATNREAGPAYYDNMVKVCMDAGFSPSIVQTANEMVPILSLVSCGMGIALINESAKHLRNDILYKPLRGTNQCAYQISLAWKKDNSSSVMKNFLEVVLDLYPND